MFWGSSINDDLSGGFSGPSVLNLGVLCRCLGHHIDDLDSTSAIFRFISDRTPKVDIGRQLCLRCAGPVTLIPRKAPSASPESEPESEEGGVRPEGHGKEP